MMAGKGDKGAGNAKVIFVKKKAKGHGHHGGAWKVAYADFVTAMMALFMVLWLVSQTDETTRSQLARYFRSGVFSGSGHVIGDTVPTGRGPTVGGGTTNIQGQHGSQAERLEATARTLEEVLDMLAADDPQLEALRGQIDVRLDESGLLIQISDGGDEILFGLASSSLTPPLEQFLAALGPILGRLSNELQIHGHTDARPFPDGATYDNWNLSFARADAARRYLEAHGVRPGQIVGVLAHADSDLLIEDDPLDPRNRRLSILAVRRGAETPAARGRAPGEGDPESPAAAAARQALEALGREEGQPTGPATPSVIDAHTAGQGHVHEGASPSHGSTPPETAHPEMGASPTEEASPREEVREGEGASPREEASSSEGASSGEEASSLEGASSGGGHSPSAHEEE